ncbi:MAG: tRNA (guanosine(46)-N7)-methyltransferase TrmB [Bacteroidia bacterium]|nr:tRNA (guanosine(46)-N7)-methyltransferase TrmB [Bacteroidia bacterium]MDW8014489.1 tRNA (guanosine(46)-N7)-methyltransferase TrmB [Bacteroidia bacterium]
MLSKIEKRRRYYAHPVALYGEKVPSPAAWRETLGFSPDAPFFLDLGCGKGEFAVYLAQRYPHALVVGLDRRADRLATGCRIASERGVHNVRFWHADALLLETHLGLAEVSTLWLNYPDPYPKRRHEKHRLLHPRFLRLYQRILMRGGSLFLRTDEPNLYFYSLEQLREAGWEIVWATPCLLPGEVEEEAAYFETEFYRKRGGTIHYIHARWRGYSRE